MNILNFLPWRRRAPIRPARRPAEIATGPTQAGDERAWGCGWFDSSHDLECGLLVREHVTADASPRELPLALWLELQWPPAPATGAGGSQALA